MAAQKEQGKHGGPAPFLIKTHQMVEDPSTDEIIAWTESGDAFVVWKPVEFARDLLPNHFKHNNFSSFVRQLNTYGFRKVVPERWEFANDNFRRGEQRLLSEIQRRKAPSLQANLKPQPSNSSKEEDQSSTSTTSSVPPSNPDQHHYNNQHLLSQENDRLKKDNELLCSELAQAKQQCRALLGFLAKYVDVEKLDGATTTADFAKVEKEMEKEQEKEMESGKEEEEGGEKEFKLFGVSLKGSGEQGNQKKRGRCEDEGSSGGRPSKIMGMWLSSPWIEVVPSQLQGTSRV